MSYFIWLILGVIAIVIEIMVPTFFALFTGIGFLFAAIVAFFYPESLFIQLISVSLFMSIGVIVFKKKNIADVKTNRVGTHNEFVGIEGVVTTSVSSTKEGEVELSKPIVGTRSWPAISNDDEIEAGAKIKIVELQGNTLLVKKIKDK
jgi:inner membrane protein